MDDKGYIQGGPGGLQVGHRKQAESNGALLVSALILAREVKHLAWQNASGPALLLP
jgi:hypothetical protein